MSGSNVAAHIDVRTIPPRDRHPLIFSAFGKLGVHQTLELVNDHDPRPLYDRFQDELASAFDWAQAERGPEVWRVHITRLSRAPAHGSCCASCGGA